MRTLKTDGCKYQSNRPQDYAPAEGKETHFAGDVWQTEEQAQASAVEKICGARVIATDDYKLIKFLISNPIPGNNGFLRIGIAAAWYQWPIVAGATER